MKNRLVSILLLIVFAFAVLSTNCISVFAYSYYGGAGTQSNPYYITSLADLTNALQDNSGSKTYFRLKNDIDGLAGTYHISGNVALDLNGHTIKGEIEFYANYPSFSLFVVDSGASFLLIDSVGGGEIIYDRHIPSMGECNADTDVFLYRGLTVFEVNGSLTVNGGEITAGHYK